MKQFTCKNNSDGKIECRGANIECKGWPRFGADHKNTFSSPDEHKISRQNITSVFERWNLDFGVDDFTSVIGLPYDGIYYILTTGNQFYAVNIETGSVLPNYPIDLHLGQYSSGSVPVIHGKYIYVATDDLKVYSFDRHNGSQNPHWPSAGVDLPYYPAIPATKASSEVQSSLSIVDDGEHELLIVSVTNAGFDDFQQGHVMAFDLKGHKKWDKPIDPAGAGGTGSWSTPSFDYKNKLMFQGSSNQKSLPANDYSDALQARDYRTGKLVWHYQYVHNDVASNNMPSGNGNPIYMNDRDVGSSPNIIDVDGKEYVGTCGKNGIYNCFSRRTGKLKWQRIITNTPTIWGNASAAVHDGVIYAVSVSDVNLEAFDPDAWMGEAIPYDFYSNVILGDDPLGNIKSFFLCTTIIEALDAKTGKVLWRQENQTDNFGGTTYANGLVYAAFLSGEVKIYHAKTGQLMHTLLTPPQDPNIIDFLGITVPANRYIPCHIVVHDGNIFVPYASFIEPLPGGVLCFSLPESGSSSSSSSSSSSRSRSRQQTRASNQLIEEELVRRIEDASRRFNRHL